MNTLKKIIYILLLLLCFVNPMLVAQDNTNRYVSILNRIIPELEVPARTSDAGGWQLRMISEDLLLRTWAVSDSRSTLSDQEKADLKLDIEESINFLFNKMLDDDNDGTNDSWNSTYVNDPNADRFILVALLDALSLIKQTGLFPTQIQLWLDKAEPAVEMQYSEYGQTTNHDYSTQSAGNYPNMDAAYILVMGLGGDLYDNSAYLNSASSFVAKIKSHLFLDGAFNYYYSTNEVPVYHDIIIKYLSRYLAITSDQQAADVISATRNYYLFSLAYPGIAESTSATWSKQYTAYKSSSVMIAIVAAVSGCGKNAWLVNYHDYVPLNSDYYYGISYWDSYSSLSVTPCNDNIMFYDNNIAGVRGKFGKFSWLGNAGSAQSSFAGATITSPSYFTHTGWIMTDYYNSPEFFTDNVFYKTGISSMAVTCTSQDIGVIRPFRQEIPGGKTYKFTAWYSNSANIVNDAIRFRLRVITEQGDLAWQASWNQSTQNINSSQIISGMAYLTAIPTESGEWKQASFEFSLPQDVTAIGLECFNYNGNGTLWLDGVSLVDSDLTAAAQDSSLVLVTPEIGLSNDALLKDRAAYICGINYPKQSLIGLDDNVAASFVQYRPRKPINPPAENPETQWLVNQSWLFLKSHVIGLVTMTSLSSQTCNYARIRIRTDHKNNLYQIPGTNNYASGELRISLLDNNFPQAEITDAVDTGWGSSIIDADLLSISDTDGSLNSYSLGQYYYLAITAFPEWESAIDEFEQINQGVFTGFKVSVDSQNYIILCNTSSATSNLNYDPEKAGGNVYLSSEEYPYQKPLAGAINSEGKVEVAVPPYGIVCIVYEGYCMNATDSIITGPFSTGSENGESYIYVPAGETPSSAAAVFSFDVKTAGYYKLTGWVQGLSLNEDSFFWQIDGLHYYYWQLPHGTELLKAYGSDVGTGIIEFWLDAGPHEIKIIGRENNARLSRLGLELVSSAVNATDSIITGPFSTGSENGESYIYVPSGETPSSAAAVFSFDVKTAGYYRLMGWVQGLSLNEDSFFWQIDGLHYYYWELPHGTELLKAYGSDVGTGIIEFWLDAGPHEIKIIGRENNARLSRLGLELVSSAVNATDSIITGPFSTGSENGESYIYVPSGETPSSAAAVFSFDVKTAGYYRLAGWVQGLSLNEDSFFWQIDGLYYYYWQLPHGTELLKAYGSDVGTGIIEFWLDVGPHEIKIIGRENNARLSCLGLELVPLIP